MSQQNNSQLVDQAALQPPMNTGGSSFATIPPGIPANRAPTTSDIAPQFTPWIYVSARTVWIQTQKGKGSLWSALGTGAVGGVVTVTGDSGGAESPDGSGNFNLLGTANQITVTGSANTETFSIPSVFIGPGSIASTTTITSGTSMVSTTTITAGTGIVSTTGNIVATAGQVNAGTSMTAGTTITATLGAITATNGNIVRGTAGNKDVYSSVASTTTAGANSAGTVTLAGGTATVATTAVTASSQIRLYRQGIGATGAAALGYLTLGTKTAGVSFVINAVQAADATALQASDVSSIGWEIVN